MRIAVGMSGGVDSTVAVALLVAQGHDAVGLTLQIWNGTVALPTGRRSSCYGPEEPQELEKTQAVAARLGIEHHIVPLTDEYREHVLDYFRREYQAGRSHNPCVKCNREVKFGSLLVKTRNLGLAFDFFATGHYARVHFDRKARRFLLRRSVEPKKDPSYFLAHLIQEQLSKVCFPLSGLIKTRVRDMAKRLGLGRIADRSESQDFVRCGSNAPLFDGLDVRPGPIVDLHGRIVGEHRGIVYYTIGQRKGLGLSGHIRPFYVVGLDATRNTIVVGPREHLFARELVATGVNWIAIDELREPRFATVRIRQQHCGARALLRPERWGHGEVVRVVFDVPQMSITPGQAVAFYENDTVLGGGWIDRSANRLMEIRP